MGPVKIKPKLLGLDRCPQCGIASPNISYQSYFTDPLDHSTERHAWFTYMCESCGDLVAAKGLVHVHTLASQPIAYLANRQIDAVQVIPGTKGVDAHLPDRPRAYLEQALASIHAPDGAVMLAGSAIDAMLKIKGLVEGSVFARIESAVKQGILTRDMSDWAHAVRLEANKPRHADLDDPHASKDEALQVVEFAKALGDFLFVFPARVADGLRAAKNAENG